MKLYRDKQGRKLYPVCNWEKNQHKLYNAHDRAYNRRWEAEERGDYDMADKANAEIETIEHLLDIFDSQVVNGIVFATWEDRNKIKDYTVAYDVRHGWRA
jgi:hypothetical protein